MAANASAKKYGFRESLAALKNPRVAAMLALGFASGLPFLLTGATFGYWLRDEGTTLTAIGFLSWVGLAYTFKVLWSPFIDRLPAPFFGKLGRRRGWALLSQLAVAGALVAMAIMGPHGPGGLATIGALALVVAFASATQDIAVDAWRIEAAADADELGLFTSVFQLGYRAALLVTDALILVFAEYFGWPISYVLMAVFMGIGVFAALRTPEPSRADAVMEEKAGAAPLWTPRGFVDAVIGPFVAFFKTHGALALLMLLMISVYRLPEFLIGPVAGPFYSDLGLEKDVVGGVRGTVGLLASILGIAAGGIAAVRLGYMRSLIVGAVLQGIGVAAYALVAIFGPNLALFSAAMATDNFCYAFAGVALITYMSSLTSLGYTATQYALLSSTYTLFGKFLKGFSGAVVDGLNQQGRTLMESYAIFYVGAGAIAVPALVLCLVLAARQPKGAPAPA
ncbi:MAG TPA: MFS transporter [Hyphomonadaceae bacterium]|nr:MFS transporter [Hyphomonadaceae bacterium]